MNILKKVIKKIILKHYNNAKFSSWPDNGLLNVGVIYNEIFSLKQWEEALRDNFPDHNKFCNIIFIKNKRHKYILAKKINVYFADWLDSKYINYAQNLQWVHFAQSGIEFLKDVNMQNINITTAGGLSSKYVAEYILATILMFLRRIDMAIINQARCKWEQKSILSRTGSIDKTTIGICGLGNNGQVAAKLCKKVGFKVVGFDREKKTSLTFVDMFFNEKELEDFIKISDFIVICLPLNESTINMFDVNQLSVMKKNACIINVSRTGIINESALRKALKTNMISGGITDVLPKEPCSFWYFLRKEKNFVITPHIAGNIRLISGEIQRDFINRLKNYLNTGKHVHD